MNNSKKFTIWMIIAIAVFAGVHSIFLYVFKNDEPFFFLLAFIAAAALITNWIFAWWDRRKNR